MNDEEDCTIEHWEQIDIKFPVIKGGGVMEKNEKVREHIQIPEKEKVTFFKVVTIIAESISKILDDELVAFAYINVQGFKVGSENVHPIEDFIYDDGTLFRAYTKKGRWRISAIRRKDSGFVTLIELLAPYNDIEKVSEVAEYVVKQTKGTRAVV